MPYKQLVYLARERALDPLCGARGSDQAVAKAGRSSTRKLSFGSNKEVMEAQRMV